MLDKVVIRCNKALPKIEGGTIDLMASEIRGHHRPDLLKKNMKKNMKKNTPQKNFRLRRRRDTLTFAYSENAILSSITVKMFACGAEEILYATRYNTTHYHKAHYKQQIISSRGSCWRFFEGLIKHLQYPSQGVGNTVSRITTNAQSLHTHPLCRLGRAKILELEFRCQR